MFAKIQTSLYKKMCFQVIFKTSDVAFTRVINLDNALVKTLKTKCFRN